MIPNQDEHGIRYGYISANILDGDVVQDLMFGSHAKNLSEIAAIEEETARQRSAWEDECESLSVAAQEAGTDLVLDDFEVELDNFESCVDEAIVEGTLEGVTYRSSWMGGALHFFIFCSQIVGRFDTCSPCVPGAGNLHSRNSDGVFSYDVPPTWRLEDESALKEGFGPD